MPREEGVDDARDGVEREGQPHAERGCGQRLHQREAYDVRPESPEPDNAEHAALAPDGGVRLLAVDARKPTPAARQIRPNTVCQERSSILPFSISSARV